MSYLRKVIYNRDETTVTFVYAFAILSYSSLSKPVRKKNKPYLFPSILVKPNDDSGNKSSPA